MKYGREDAEVSDLQLLRVAIETAEHYKVAEGEIETAKKVLAAEEQKAEAHKEMCTLAEVYEEQFKNHMHM